VPGLFLYYDIRSRFLDGAEVFRQARALLAGRDDPAGRQLQAQLMVGEGWFLRYTEPGRSRSLVREGHDLLGEGEPGADLALAKVLGAIVDVWPSAEDLVLELRRAAEIFEAADDRWGLALTLEVMSFNICAENPAEAMACARRSLKLRRQIGDAWGITLALYILGLLAEQQGMHALARRRYQESLDRRRSLGEDLDGTAACLSSLGRVCRRLGDRERAARYCQESLMLAREMGNRWREASVLILSGLLSYEFGEYAAAKERLEETLPLLDNLGETGWLPMVLALLGNVHLALSHPEEASVVLEQELPESDGDPPSAPPSPFKWLGLGRLAVERGELPLASDHLLRAVAAGRESKNSEVPMEAMLELARLEQRARRSETAAEIVAHILDHAQVGPATRAHARALRAEIAENLPFSALKNAELRGKRRRLDDLVVLVTSGAEGLLPEERA
jgi:tetratricopeptide (TPR) repeat protein